MAWRSARNSSVVFGQLGDAGLLEDRLVVEEPVAVAIDGDAVDGALEVAALLDEPVLGLEVGDGAERLEEVRVLARGDAVRDDQHVAVLGRVHPGADVRVVVTDRLDRDLLDAWVLGLEWGDVELVPVAALGKVGPVVEDGELVARDGRLARCRRTERPRWRTPRGPGTAAADAVAAPPLPQATNERLSKKTARIAVSRFRMLLSECWAPRSCLDGPRPATTRARRPGHAASTLG